MPQERQPINNKLVAGRIRELDGIRGLAILMVVAYHYLEGGALLDPHSFFCKAFVYALPYFDSGVKLFFCSFSVFDRWDYFRS